MASRYYGQFCGLVRAVEIVGERWALLIVRDLVLGPKRFTDLHRGLPRIPTNVLSARLKGLEEAGVVQRTVQPRPGSGIVYELTEYGRDLEDVLLRLGLWGARSLGEPGPEDIVTPDSMTLALRATFRPQAARGLHAGYELRVGDVTVHARIDGSKLDAQPGPLPDADLIIKSGPAIRALLAGEIMAEQALASGDVVLTGNEELFDPFLDVFHIPPKP